MILTCDLTLEGRSDEWNHAPRGRCVLVTLTLQTNVRPGYTDMWANGLREVVGKRGSVCLPVLSLGDVWTNRSWLCPGRLEDGGWQELPTTRRGRR
jgi:hypothetical protein